MRIDPNIIDDYIKAIDYINFQDFCDRLLITLYPNDYTPVRAGGRNGDMKNDGYCAISRTFFQAHATRGESSSKTKAKIKSDLEGCLKNWKDVRTFIYITNDTLLGEVENFIDKLRKKHKPLKIQTWSNKILTSKLKDLEPKDLEYVIERKLFPELNILDSEVLSAKYLITKEFNFIKEISEGDLSNFPFENPLLFENETLSFLRKLIKGQSYRNSTVEKIITTKEKDYLKVHKDACVIPSKEGEYRFLYHERIPSSKEIKSELSSDNISQFLLYNGVPKEKISKINTCYEDECGGGYNFQEAYLLRPFYAKFLIIKNISKAPIILESLTSIYLNGVLYNIDLESKQETSLNLPNFNIESHQNIIVPVGLFLSEFKEFQDVNKSLITSSWCSGQFQELNKGKLVKSNPIEYVGPSFHPKSITAKFRDIQINSKIHEFSFDSLYWIDRHWECGSCPHLFFVKDGELLYQGELFNVLPDDWQSEKILIPLGVNQIIIAELEHETTYIEYLLKNNAHIESDIVLSQGQYFSIIVSPNDILKLRGKYTLKNKIYKKLSTQEKMKLIEQFKFRIMSLE